MDPYRVFNDRRLGSANKEIRLLHVLNGPKDAILICVFEHVPLTKRPDYAALSYCWGTSPERKTIMLEGRLFPVTCTVEEALRGLRTKEDDRHLVIWIDAVCINLDDLDERGEQVAMMKDVYQSARKTIVWLGDRAGDGEIVADIMVYIWKNIE